MTFHPLARAVGLCLAALLWSGPAGAEPPRRVVSMNLCTDQLAMALAAPGQLISVSYLARDPRSSAMADKAMGYPVNRGRAEEIYLLKPDLVLTAGYGGPAVAMLHRLGVPVVEIASPTSLEQARVAIREVGAALDRREAAETMVADFDARLARLTHPAGPSAPRAATWGPNGYSVGGDTLAGDILRKAGFTLVADRLGMKSSGSIPLDVLVMADPDLIVTGTPFPGAARAEQMLDHPALDRLSGRMIRIPDALWTCAQPATLDALAMLSAEAEALK